MAEAGEVTARSLVDNRASMVIRVKRWRCQACGRTFSSLPSFVLAYRHYLVEVIQPVLVGRLELG
ncbi:MAG: DUF6431 domain-containing protein, partial [Chloroflexota bacterium]